eukprot:CAMPEP_0203897336 /NCGR_PEP_ID=MMETSP0359-20131031/39975_1 /ASSEMBLY_ACC=CAM_ASM_000338 /TAXON_ID=268821 /ORGANISM="Scrippsiella Hangoei, Strain SHTV-5" /LENGTH=69 /DNA_ID=CAMNT_0050820209 /DNA_START=110 /DNA_END=320 /DNA_ORIENTATION=-
MPPEERHCLENSDQSHQAEASENAEDVKRSSRGLGLGEEGDEGHDPSDEDTGEEKGHVEQVGATLPGAG